MNKGRKISGGKYRKQKKTKLAQRPGKERQVILGEDKRKNMNIRGGNTKTVLLASNVINIVSKGKIQQANITAVEETPQNKFLARRNRLMKGVIVTTSMGKARITNRPSQEGIINGILLE